MEILYENTQAKHAEEVSALQRDYETQLLELKRTTDSLNDMINNVRKENTTLNKSLIKIREENSNLKYDYKLSMKKNEDLQEKLKEATEALQAKSIEDRKSTSEFQSQPNVSECDYANCYRLSVILRNMKLMIQDLTNYYSSNYSSNNYSSNLV